MFNQDHATSLSAAPSALLTKQEAADFLRIKIRTLDEWRTMGRLKVVTVGRYIRFRRADLEEFITSHTRIPRPCRPCRPYRPRKQNKPV